ncbi:MAG: glutamate racemase, partial [Oscillospiraceae bacterium]
LPGEDIKYLGDTLRMPYGVKTIEELREFAKNNVAFLQRRDVKLVAAACGTVSSNVAREDMDNLSVPFVDVIHPTVTAALYASKSRRIGIIATPATVRAQSIENRLKAQDSRVQVISVGCPSFVPLIEEGHIDDEEIIAAAREYLAPIKGFGVDVLILGCTHYPIISSIIMNIMGDGVALVDSGKETAFEIKRVLESCDIACGKSTGGSAEYFVTARPDAFDGVAKIFLGEDERVHSQLTAIED